MSKAQTTWSPDPPDSEGLWWLYGDEEFGVMGGHYSGTIPLEKELHVVEVRRISNGLIGVNKGRMIGLRPFDKENRKCGYVGVWQKIALPELPKE